jgi:hypothetical protein
MMTDTKQRQYWQKPEAAPELIEVCYGDIVGEQYDQVVRVNSRGLLHLGGPIAAPLVANQIDGRLDRQLLMMDELQALGLDASANQTMEVLNLFQLHQQLASKTDHKNNAEVAISATMPTMVSSNEMMLLPCASTVVTSV